MAALADLAPDRRALLQLLVARGRGYDEIAELLSLPEIVVRRRAHDAIAQLAGDGARVDDAADRALICDYLVGELPASRRAEARRRLADDPAARRFARAAAARLSAIPGAQLPELPPEDAEVAEALDALDARRERQQELRSSSRRGGWLLIGGIVLAVVAAVVAISAVTGGDDGNPARVPDTPEERRTASGENVTYVSELAAPSGNAEGEAALRPNEDGAIVLALNAENLAPSLRLEDGRIAVYGVWFDGPQTDPLFIGFPPSVGQDGALSLGGVLNGVDNSPAVSSGDMEQYDTLLVTREVLEDERSRPSRPGRTALEGQLEIVR